MIDLSEKLVNDLHAALNRFMEAMTTEHTRLVEEFAAIHAEFALGAKTRQDQMHQAVTSFVDARIGQVSKTVALVDNTEPEMFKAAE